jgi:hypothetical protein
MKYLLVTEHWVDADGWPEAQAKLSTVEDAIARSGVDAELNQSYVEDEDTGERQDAQGDPV